MKLHDLPPHPHCDSVRLKKIYEIYAVIFPGNKMYIGMTASGVSRRIERHYSNPNSAIYTALDKNWSKCKYTILGTAKTKFNALMLERQFIREYKEKGVILYNRQKMGSWDTESPKKLNNVIGGYGPKKAPIPLFNNKDVVYNWRDGK